MDNNFIIYTFGNQELIYHVLLSIGKFFGGNIFFVMAKLAAITTILLFLFHAIGVTTRENRAMKLDIVFFIRFYLIYAIFILVPCGKNIIIKDSVLGIKIIGLSESKSIPFGMVIIGSYLSQTTNIILKGYEYLFNHIHNSDETIDESSKMPSYISFGMAFAPHILSQISQITLDNLRMDTATSKNFINYTTNCIIPIAYTNNKTKELLYKEDILHFMLQDQMLVEHSNNRYVSWYIANNSNSYLIQKSISCHRAGQEIEKIWQNNYKSIYLPYIAGLFGFQRDNFYSNANNSTNTLDLLNELNVDSAKYLKQIDFFILGMQKIAKTFLNITNDDLGLKLFKQIVIINLISDSIKEPQISSTNYETQNKISSFLQYLGSFLIDFLFIMIFILYPIVIFYALILSIFSPIFNYISYSFAIHLMPLILEIINTICNIYASQKTSILSMMAMDKFGISLAIIHELTTINHNFILVTNLLILLAPFLALLLVFGVKNIATNLFSNDFINQNKTHHEQHDAQNYESNNSIKNYQSHNNTLKNIHQTLIGADHFFSNNHHASDYFNTQQHQSNNSFYSHVYQNQTSLQYAQEHQPVTTALSMMHHSGNAQDNYNHDASFNYSVASKNAYIKNKNNTQTLNEKKNAEQSLQNNFVQNDQISAEYMHNNTNKNNDNISGNNHQSIFSNNHLIINHTNQANQNVYSANIKNKIIFSSSGKVGANIYTNPSHHIVARGIYDVDDKDNVSLATTDNLHNAFNNHMQNLNTNGTLTHAEQNKLVHSDQDKLVKVYDNMPNSNMTAQSSQAMQKMPKNINIKPVENITHDTIKFDTIDVDEKINKLQNNKTIESEYQDYGYKNQPNYAQPTNLNDTNSKNNQVKCDSDLRNKK